MKFLQLQTFSDAALAQHYAARPELLDATHADQVKGLIDSGNAALALWAPVLSGMGHDAQLFIANDPVSQFRWASEHLDSWKLKKREEWQREIALEQVNRFQPDVLHLGDPVRFDMSFVRRLKQRPRWVTGWNTAPAKDEVNWHGFDLMLSPYEACLEQAWKKKVRDVRPFLPGFPSTIADSVAGEPLALDVAYCGRWVPGQEKRNKRITALAKAAMRKDKPFRLGLFLEVPDGVELPPPVRKLNQGPRLGLDRYHAMRSARIVVNEELDEALGTGVSPGLLESTGVGVFTLAAENDRLPVLFKPGSEVVTYRGSADMVDKIDAHLGMDREREMIAKAGQERCCADHNAEKGMRLLLGMLAGNPGGLCSALRRAWHRLKS